MSSGAATVAATGTPAAWPALGRKRFCLEEAAKLTAGQLAVAQNRSQEAGSDALSRVDRDYRGATVGVPQNLVAAPHAHNLEPGTRQSGDEPLTR